mmetsp:Transcript_31040/g.68886  ORF Transcript_31040/g.68886 Transcript_31040/m.68886 type:complete len:184 (+) Transcript_31040:248-799(+)|eukprot:CAMPEP_0202892034 /NCGR_PEP_ID=MMETSP1392-20130828/1892_1 /ASSEMBLY_ACC=CAM_ASM_000868 /TAXON_ID=225041 /ORGANISM="Chlamydomonas chlamydogama, Strain SAG 11-48b" /LENGTH=183 /DNA_ID=CAMNT_0049575909 /DNA_START=213 /DNA_END=764 /DNA_ORIENTATION=+
MGALVSTLWGMWFGGKEYKIVMVGLDNAGKTTILYKLHLGEVVVSQATVGSNVEMVKYRNIQLEIWDLGGQQNLRPFWATYYKNTDAVIMVVDSTDRARVGVTKSELFNLLENEDLAKTPILVLANKQDLKDAMGVEEMTGALSLHSIRNHDWHIQACCALSGEGLMEGLAWIHQRTKGGQGK